LEDNFSREQFDEHIQRHDAKELDWDPFEGQAALDPKYRRGHVRMVGASITGKHFEPGTIPANNFTLSVMTMPPDAVAPSHAHEVEEVFFVLKGEITAWWERADGTREQTVLKEKQMIYSPAGVMHGLHNHTNEDVQVQVVIGVGKPEKPSYLDESLAGT
tara:strand:- start:319 stop:798 length:480 start_codon:yes stop_codon:yes gene_type:complete